MSGTLTPAVLMPLLRELRRRRPDEQLIGVRLDGGWSGEEEIELEAGPQPVRVCRSVIDVRAAAVEQQALDAPLVILTPLADRDLGLDLTARLAGQQLLRPSLHRSVMQLFEAHDIDRRIAGEKWLLRALVEHLPASGYVPVPAGSLTADRAWEELLRAVLDLPAGTPTLLELLRWSQDDVHRALLQQATPELRGGVRERLAPVAGADLLLAIVEQAASTTGVIAVIGLLSILVAEPEAPAVLMATGRVAERHLGGSQLDLAEAAPALVAATRKLLQGGAISGPWGKLTRELVGGLGLDAQVPASDLLAEAWSARLAAVGDGLTALLAGTAGAEERAADAEAALSRHVLAQADGSTGSLAAIEAMSRLVRWLAVPAPAAAATLRTAIDLEVSDGSWVVWARSILAAPGAVELAEAAQRVSAAVDARRTRISIAFGEIVTPWDGVAAGELIGVEHVLDRVLAPVALAAPVVAIVMDGLSLGILRQLLRDLERDGWSERRPAGATHRPAALAVLPSLTKYSRTSLLTGQLQVGAQGAEKAGFAAHPGLREAGTAGGPPLLLHKGELSDDGTTMSTLLRDELFGPRRVVGLVINAVDDELSGAVQRRGGWRLAEIPLLAAVMAAARDAERAVVLISDHGHVPERPDTHRVATGPGAGHRHRPPTSGPVGPGEVSVSGPRVLPTGTEVILAVNPAIRYSSGTEPGYHGGASPEELVAPVAILTAFDGPLSGLEEQPPDEPSWWRATVAPLAEPEPVHVPVRPAKRGARSPGPDQPTLDGMLDVSAHIPVAAPAWIDGLLAHSTFVQASERAGRGALPRERARALLVALAQHDGRLATASLASAAGVPHSRLEGVLSALRPLVNVDGYLILTVDPAADLVELRIDDLRRQFEL